MKGIDDDWGHSEDLDDGCSMAGINRVGNKCRAVFEEQLVKWALDYVLLFYGDINESISSLHTSSFCCDMPTGTADRAEHGDASVPPYWIILDRQCFSFEKWQL